MKPGTHGVGAEPSKIQDPSRVMVRVGRAARSALEPSGGAGAPPSPDHSTEGPESGAERPPRPSGHDRPNRDSGSIEVNAHGQRPGGFGSYGAPSNVPASGSFTSPDRGEPGSGRSRAAGGEHREAGPPDRVLHVGGGPEHQGQRSGVRGDNSELVPDLPFESVLGGIPGHPAEGGTGAIEDHQVDEHPVVIRSAGGKYGGLARGELEERPSGAQGSVDGEKGVHAAKHSSDVAWRCKARKVLAKALNQYGNKDLATRLNCCRTVVAIAGHSLSVQLELCRQRVCPFCSWSTGRKHGEELAGVLRLVFAERKPRQRGRHAICAFVTATRRAIRGESAKAAVAGIMELWKGIQRSSWRRQRPNRIGPDVGGFWRRETERAARFWHSHMHAVVELSPGWTVTRYKREFREQWRALGGGYVRITAVTPARAGALGCELNKLANYMVKGGLAKMKSAEKFKPRRWAEWAGAEAGRRGCDWFGRWRDLRRIIQLPLPEVVDLEGEPQLRSDDGELPSWEGDKDFGDFARVTGSTDWGAQRVRNWVGWWLRMQRRERAKGHILMRAAVSVMRHRRGEAPLPWPPKPAKLTDVHRPLTRLHARAARDQA